MTYMAIATKGSSLAFLLQRKTPVSIQINCAKTRIQSRSSCPLTFEKPGN